MVCPVCGNVVIEDLPVHASVSDEVASVFGVIALYRCKLGDHIFLAASSAGAAQAHSQGACELARGSLPGGGYAD